MFENEKTGMDRDKAMSFMVENGFGDDVASSVPQNPFKIEKYFADLLKKDSIPVKQMLDRFNASCNRKFTGWMHKTGMTLLYMTKENT